jgi:hypothetical protein
MDAGLLVAGVITAAGAVAALVFLPAQARDAQDELTPEQRASTGPAETGSVAGDAAVAQA